MKTNLLKSIFISLILVMGVSNAWAYNQSAVDLYFDNSEAKWSSCYVYIGHSTWTSCYPLTRVSGTQYLWKLAKADFNGGSAWNGATGWVMCYEKWWDSKGESIDKYTWHGAKNVTKKRTSAWSASYIYKTNGTVSVTSDGNTINAYNTTTVSNKNYTVTINTVEGGTLTVKDYDNNAVASGASKIHLTVLKFSATPADGYVLDAVEINDGTNTTTIAVADLATTTHTLTSAVTITPVWHATTSTVTVTATATNGTVTGGGVVEEGTSVTLTATPADGYKFVNWTVGGAEVSTANPYTFTAEEDVTVVANFEELPKTTVYFVNTHGWTDVKAYAYSPANASWPGVDATLEAEKIGDFEVYSYTATEGKYANVIFNGSGGQTADLTWTDGKYYIHQYNSNTGWYTQAEAEAILVVPVEYEYVYLINTNDWAKAHIYTWTPEVAGWPGAAMTKEAEQIAGKDVYSYKVVKGTTFGGMNFNCGGDECKTGNLTWQAGKYYAPSKDKWYDDAVAAEAGLAPDPLATNVYLAGDMNSWSATANEFRKATGEATTANVTVNLTANSYTFKLVRGGDWFGNYGTMQRGGNGVHEGGWSFDETAYEANCTIVADFPGDYTFTWNLETKKLTVTYPELPTYTVTATTENGTVTGAGEYKHGTEATLVATPNAGYAFVNWKKGEEVVSSEASYTFTVTANTDLVAVFAPEETHEVTISYLCNSNPIPGHDATTLAVGVTTPSTITAPAITNYKFDSWTVGTGVQAVDAKANPIQITTKAEGDYTLAANYTKIELTYNVQVPDGTEKCFIATSMNDWNFTEMTKIDDTHYTITIDGATKEMEYKYACQASWDYEELQANGSSVSNRKWSAKDVVAKWKDPLATDIYLVGSMNSWNTTAHEFKKLSTEDTIASVTLKNLGKGTYQFKIIDNGIWLGNFGTMERGGTGVHEGGWIFENLVGGDETNCKLVADIDGEYTFTWNINAKKLTVTYPTKDYRLVYVESESGGAPYTKFRASQPIHYQIEGEKRDTISFYINKEGQNPAILLQQCEVDNGSATWNTIATQSINGVQGGDPGQAKAPTKRAPELKIGNGFPNIESSGVYNFVLEQTNNNAEHNAQILSQETHAYVGNYYIRTDAAEGRWDEYKTHKDNIMTHSQTVLTYDDYNYYFCAWVLKDQNVKYVVANDYSYCISDTLASDDIVTNVHGNLPADANVRYTWNSETNALARAYLSGSGDIKYRYLVLVGDSTLKDLEENTFNIDGLYPNEANFKDMENWLYQLDVKANKNTRVKLTADYNGETQYFKGGADTTVQLIKGADDYYTLRLIYDFKTNYLVSGLVGNQTITGDLELEEVMIVRSHHDEAQTLKISNGSVTANKAYGVMTFNKDTLNDNKKSQHERALYWVSFPFDVQLDKVFGFGNYGEHWIMEYYDGAERAEKGLWKEPTYSYWKFIEDPKGYILEAGQGYVLCLDLDLLGNNAEFWKHDNTEIALYFPSNGKDTIVINNQATVRETIVPEHECTIDRDDRKNKDSNWNIIGVPAYTKIAKMVGENIFYYQYNAAKDSFELSNTLNFNTMHAYMVQFADTINWIEQATSIAALAARKSPTSKDQYTLRLALQQEGADHDHTFIRLQEDKATAEFDMNYDLCKIINSGANIYSMINDVEVAANVLPVEERVIPIGLDIHETGNYTFAMPDGTDGITAILIDYETGKETNLLLADYTTELREGTNNGRFALRVRPNHVATAVETIIDGANGQIQKYIINGALYILNNGQLYDAQGRMVQP